MPTSSRWNALLHGLMTLALLVVGGVAFEIVWIVIAQRSEGRAGWMAVLAAVNTVGLLQIARLRRGASRASVALLTTSACVAVGEWVVGCLPIAADVGQSPLEAAQRMGADFSWMLIRLGNTPLDWCWVALALALAAWFGR